MAAGAPYYTESMRGLLAGGFIALLVLPIFAQTRKPARRAPAPPVPVLTRIAPEMNCPAPLGTGVNTNQTFCDVMTGRDPAVCEVEVKMALDWDWIQRGRGDLRAPKWSLK